MKDFANAAFPPDVIEVMQQALDEAIATLPHPISSAHIQSIAETVLRSAKEGERNPATLKSLALLELQISPRN
jgi:hypothetical protein